MPETRHTYNNNSFGQNISGKKVTFRIIQFMFIVSFYNN